MSFFPSLIFITSFFVFTQGLVFSSFSSVLMSKVISSPYSLEEWWLRDKDSHNNNRPYLLWVYWIRHLHTLFPDCITFLQVRHPYCHFTNKETGVCRSKLSCPRLDTEPVWYPVLYGSIFILSLPHTEKGQGKSMKLGAITPKFIYSKCTNMSSVWNSVSLILCRVSALLSLGFSFCIPSSEFFHHSS